MIDGDDAGMSWFAGNQHNSGRWMMRWMVVFATIAVLFATTALAEDGGGGLDLNGGYGGLMTWTGEGTFGVGTVQLGATYIPEIIDNRSLAVAQSKWRFWDLQVFRDDMPDLNMGGLGYVVYDGRHTVGFQIIAETAAVFQSISDNRVKVGAYGGVQIPFEAVGQRLRVTLGAGWDGDDPLIRYELNFVGL